jgi:hypothetical protein
LADALWSDGGKNLRPTAEERNGLSKAYSMAADRVRKSIHKRYAFFWFSLRTCAVGALARRESKMSAGVLPDNLGCKHRLNCTNLLPNLNIACATIARCASGTDRWPSVAVLSCDTSPSWVAPVLRVTIASVKSGYGREICSLPLQLQHGRAAASAPVVPVERAPRFPVRTVGL